MKSPEQACMAYAELDIQIKECNRVIRFTHCAEASKPDYQCGDPGAPSCLSQFFANVAEVITMALEGKSFQDAREEVLSDMSMCDVCKEKLRAIELRKSLKIKASGAIRTIATVGKRLREQAREKGMR